MGFDLALVTAPFRMQPGLRRIAPGAPQLTPAKSGSRHRREKLAVLAAFAEEALASVAGFDPAPLFQAVAVEAARFDADAFVTSERTGGRAVSAPRLGWSVDAAGRLHGGGDRETGDVLGGLPAHHRAAALLCLAFEEDFAVIDGATGTLPWLAVALPSRWAPREKVGRRFAQVHAPVADNALLLASAEALTRLVTAGGERWERFVWTITPEPRLHQHPARGALSWERGNAAEIAAAAFFRSERQTFIPIPGTGQSVFTIHVESTRLGDAIASAEAAARVHDALASMSPAVLAYRNLAGVREPLLQWLAGRAAAAEPARRPGT